MEKRLYSPSYVREILNKFDFNFTKSLGQNFLIDGNIVRGIVEKSDIDENSYVLEVGPGFGTLTEELAQRAKKVVAVEIDRSLEEVLDYTLRDYDNVEVVFGDILKLDIEKLIDEKLGGGPVHVVANLPYYITTPIIARFIEEDLNVDSLTVMVQKEVAERIVSGPGTKAYGSLSVFVQFYTEAEIIIEAPKTVFMPQPNVDSSVVRMKIRKEPSYNNKEKFFKLVKAAFSMRRKTLLNCLSKADFNMDKGQLEEKLIEIGIDPKIRGERLEIEDFIKIAENID